MKVREGILGLLESTGNSAASTQEKSVTFDSYINNTELNCSAQNQSLTSHT